MWIPLMSGIINAVFILDLIVTLTTGDDLAHLLLDASGNTVASAITENIPTDPVVFWLLSGFILVFVCAIFCVWTTQDNNIYSASLSLQNIFVDTKLEGKVKHAWLAIIVAALAAIFAAVGAVKYLLPVVKALSVLLPPIPAMMIAEQWCVKNSKENQNINWVGIVSWIVATVIGQICVNRNFLIPAVVSMVVAFLLYLSLIHI